MAEPGGDLTNSTDLPGMGSLRERLRELGGLELRTDLHQARHESRPIRRRRAVDARPGDPKSMAGVIEPENGDHCAVLPHPLAVQGTAGRIRRTQSPDPSFGPASRRESACIGMLERLGRGEAMRSGVDLPVEETRGDRPPDAVHSSAAGIIQGGLGPTTRTRAGFNSSL